jgi:hypothetical protein
MRRFVVGGTAVVLISGIAIVAGSRDGQASEPFEKILEIKCAKCHTEKDKMKMSEKDLTDCGKASLKVMQDKLGFKFVAGKKYDDAAGKQTMTTLGKGLLKEKFKCP